MANITDTVDGLVARSGQTPEVVLDWLAENAELPNATTEAGKATYTLTKAQVDHIRPRYETERRTNAPWM